MNFVKNFSSSKSLILSRARNITFRIQQITMLQRMFEDNFEEMRKISIETKSSLMCPLDFKNFLNEIGNMLENFHSWTESEKVTRDGNFLISKSCKIFLLCLLSLNRLKICNRIFFILFVYLGNHEEQF